VETLLGIDKLLFEPPELGCVLCLPGLPSGGNKIHDRSPYGNHGTITGATWTRTPSGLWCLSFDGVDDYVDFGYNLNLTSALTVVFWLYPLSIRQQEFFVNFKSFGGNNYGGYDIYMGGNGKMRFQVGKTVGTDDLEGTTVLTADQWTHVAAVHDGVKLYIYINGKSDKTPKTATQVPWNASTRSTRLGEVYYGDKPHAYVALLTMANHGFSAGKIWQHYESTKRLFGVW
jgi:hypothetical protein